MEISAGENSKSHHGSPDLSPPLPFTLPPWPAPSWSPQTFVPLLASSKRKCVQAAESLAFKPFHWPTLVFQKRWELLCSQRLPLLRPQPPPSCQSAAQSLGARLGACSSLRQVAASSLLFASLWEPGSMSPPPGVSGQGPLSPACLLSPVCLGLPAGKLRPLTLCV